MRHIPQYLTTNRKAQLHLRETNHLTRNNLFNVVKISKNQQCLLLKVLSVIHQIILVKKFKSITVIKPILVRHKHRQDRVQHRLLLTINQWTISNKHMTLERKNFKTLRSFLLKVNLTLRLSVRRQNCWMNKTTSYKNKLTSWRRRWKKRISREKKLVNKMIMTMMKNILLIHVIPQTRKNQIS